MPQKKQLRRELYYLLFTLAMPIVVQNLIGNSLVLIDTVMIARLGEQNVAAVGIAGRLQFIFTLLAFGFYAGGGVFVAQYNGARQTKRIRPAMALQVAIGIGIAIVFTVIGTVFGEEYMRIFSKDEEVIRIGVGYLRFMSLGFIPWSVGYAFVIALRSIKDPVLPMVVSVIALAMNTLLNYGLIFGNFGLPRLEAQGAAIATTMARVIEFTLMLISIRFGERRVLRFHPLDITHLRRDFLREYFKVSWPIIVGEALWGLGTVMYSLAYSKLGTSSFAAAQMSQNVNDIMLVASFGLSSSVGTILGNKLGERKVDEAIYFSRVIMWLSVIVGLMTGAVLLLILPIVPWIFQISGETARNVTHILMVRAVVNCLITFNWTNITGILRSGGDTVVALIIDILPMWCIGIPVAFLGALVWHWPIHWVVLSSLIDEVMRFLFGMPRALKNKWAKELV